MSGTYVPETNCRATDGPLVMTAAETALLAKLLMKMPNNEQLVMPRPDTQARVDQPKTSVLPAFTDSKLRSDRELARYTGWSLLDELRRDEIHSRMAETEVAQPANFSIQVALAAPLERFGIRPDAVIGHSAGEVAAHHLAGLLSFEQAIEVIHHRGRLQQRTSGLGRMLASASTPNH